MSPGLGADSWWYVESTPANQSPARQPTGPPLWLFGPPSRPSAADPLEVLPQRLVLLAEHLDPLAQAAGPFPSRRTSSRWRSAAAVSSASASSTVSSILVILVCNGSARGDSAGASAGWTIQMLFIAGLRLSQAAAQGPEQGPRVDPVHAQALGHQDLLEVLAVPPDVVVLPEPTNAFVNVGLEILLGRSLGFHGTWMIPRPPVRRTRASSRMARVSSGTCSSTWKQISRSIEPEANGR